MKCPRRVESGADNEVFKVGGKDDEWDLDNCCTYCGSLNPDVFLKRAEAGEKLGPTDKSYKVYVGGRDKFYFQHLDEPQKRKFVELLNEKKLNLDFPGRFYVLPFFIARG